jgi:ATP-binding cassette subfamily B protein
MTDGLTSCAAMLRIGWINGRGRLILATVLSIAAGLTWPLVALGLRAGTDAAVAHDVHAATVAGAITGAGVIGVLMLRHFAYCAFVEIADLAVVTLESELIMLANASAGLEHHERPEYADKMEILRREVSGLIGGIGALMTMTTLGISLLSTGVLLAFVNPWLLLLPLAAVPPVLAGQRSSTILERGKEKAATATRQSWHLFRLATSADSAKEIRVFRLQGELQQRDRELWNAAGGVILSAEKRAVLVGTAGQFVFATAYVLAVLLVVRQAVVGRSAVGDVVLVITLAAQVNAQVNQALNELRNMQRIGSGFARLRWLRGVIAAQRPAPSDAPLPESIRGGIELCDLEFSYPGVDTPVLQKANILLPPGSTVAIVGENGAGKTTLVKLLCRFYEPTGGAITLDGVDIRRFPLDEWRRRISVGFQDFVRFELLARETVGVGDLPLIDDEHTVVAALERAHAGDVVLRLDDGLATQLGKTHSDGAELSGGQWQKLALGRAFMRESPLLLVLDEPTAALDAEAEHELFERYAERAKHLAAETGAITVLVTHRFSTVRAADLILVVADGRIAEAGSHRDLIAQNGLYAELYALQASAYE